MMCDFTVCVRIRTHPICSSHSAGLLFFKRKQPSAPGLSWCLITGAVLEAWKPRRLRRDVACSRWPLIYAIVGCAVRPRNSWLARLSSRSMACSKVCMFWEDCLDELVLASAASTSSWPTTWFCCQSNSCPASVFARVYIITAYLSVMSAAAVSDVLWLAFWQSLRFVVRRCSIACTWVCRRACAACVRFWTRQSDAKWHRRAARALAAPRPPPCLLFARACAALI